MKHHSKLVLALLFSAMLPSSLDAEDQAPLIPVGSLSAYPTIVKTGTKPQLTWDITLPESVEDIVEITDPGTITPKKTLDMEIFVLGVGINYYWKDKLWHVETEATISIDGGKHTRFFYDTGDNVDPSNVAYSKEVKAGKDIDFGARYYHNNKWSTRWTSTNSPNNVVALKNGDIPPTTTPMHESATIESFIRPYLSDDGKMILGPKEVILLFEITHSDTSKPGFDLQDMAVLVSFSEPD